MKQDQSNLQIIKLLGDGFTTKEIGVKLSMKTRTVTDRIEQMKKKYHCRTVAQLVLSIVQYNLLYFTTEQEQEQNKKPGLHTGP